MQREFLLWSYLGILNKDRFSAIQDVYGDFAEAAKHIGPDMLRGLGCRSDTVEKILLRLEEYDEAKYIGRLEKSGLTFLTLDDGRYPVRLRNIGDPPVFLYAKGDLSILSEPCIGLVGTRKMTAYGRRVTEDFVPEFVKAGCITVSGLASGIDSRVAEETMKAGGKTVAVLGHGLAMIHPPANEALAGEIVDRGGLLISEFPLDQTPDTYTFPARNRIIAGLTLATVVLEAPEGSGALITAELALEYGRDIFVVPGPIFDENYKGSNAFISSGHGRLVTSAAQVMEDLGIVAPTGGTRKDFNPRTTEEGALYPKLTTMPQKVDDLVMKSALTAAQVNATLLMLELEGAAKNVGQGQWVRS